MAVRKCYGLRMNPQQDASTVSTRYDHRSHSLDWQSGEESQTCTGVSPGALADPIARAPAARAVLDGGIAGLVPGRVWSMWRERETKSHMKYSVLGGMGGVHRGWDSIALWGEKKWWVSCTTSRLDGGEEKGKKGVGKERKG